MRVPWFALALLAAGVAAAGCGPAGGGRHLSGKVTFAGKPIPVGKIYFLPDPAQGGSGAGGFADVKNGNYDTRNKGAAAPAGALIVRFEAWDGVTTPTNAVGQPLFLNYEVKVTLSREEATRDFDVPASAAKGLSKTGEPP
jgi:hypothetical protein